MGHEVLQFTPQHASSLKGFIAVAKFQPEPAIFYPGAPTEEIRSTCEAHINALAERLLIALATAPRKAVALAEFEKALAGFEQSDSEERDRACAYIEQIMDILGIDSSDGLLNAWRYGFDPSSIQGDA